MMLKRLLLTAVALTVTARAQAAPVWEYATYIDLGFAVAWSAADAPSVSGKDITEIIAALKCPKPGITGLLNCVGANGWELVQVTNVDRGAATYIFKRVKQ